ncbi:MAG: N-acetylglucosamine-6-phosphate deacetylase [Chthoniobacterales bacterium]
MKLPSLFDLQVNGFGGIDFQTEKLSQAELGKAVVILHERYMPRIFLTLITNTIDALADQFARVEKYRAADSKIAETIVGYHLEGPFLNPTPGYCGAHPGEVMHEPNIEEFERLQRAANGNIRLITIAPEWKGSAEFIEAVTAQGVVVSLGHTCAEDADIDMAIRAGAKLCTHVGNGIPSELHRHENIMQRLLARDELIACFIPDGIHIPPYALKNYFRAKAPGKAVFTTDCMSAAGAPDGEYMLGSHKVVVGKDRVVRQPGKTTFAGSSLSLDTGVANVHHWLGISVETAWDLCSTKVADIFNIALPQIEVPANWSASFKDKP